MRERNLKLPLFISRVSRFYFLAPWVLLRFVSLEQIQGIASRHYYTESFPQTLNLALGVFGVVSLLAFVAGFKKRLSYGAVFLFLAIGTLLSFPKMIPGVGEFKIVFLAALPTLVLMGVLYYLRDEDTLLTIDK